MQINRRNIMILGVFSLAAVTGNVMQNGDAIANRMRSSGLISTAQTVEKTNLTSAVVLAQGATSKTALSPTKIAAYPPRILPDLPTAEPRQMSLDTRVALQVSRVEADYQHSSSLADREFDVFGQLCAEPTLTLTPLKSAMLGVALTAPCHPDERVQISHAGITFAATTDAQGNYATTLPALAADGRVTVRLDRGRNLVAEHVVADLGAVTRFAMTTRGQSGLHLNAGTQSLAESEPVRLHSGAPGLPTLGHGGFLTLLGDPTLDHPVLTEVITTSAIQGYSHMEIVGIVDQGNCGRDVLATTQTLQGSIAPDPGAITLAMPGCDAIGDQIVLDVGADSILAQLGAQN